MLRRIVVTPLLVLSVGVPLTVVPLAFPPMASADSFIVTTTNDVVDGGDGLTSLREAITAADAATGADTIVLGNFTYELSLSCGTDDDTNAGGDLDVGSPDGLTIAAASASARATITLGAACTGERLIDIVTTGPLTLENLILDGGTAPDGATDASGEDGGAIFGRTGAITATDVEFTGNSAGDAGLADTSTTAAGSGGAIYSSGDVTLTRCTFTGNTAGSGYLAATNALESSGGIGGAVVVLGAGNGLTIIDSTFTSNAAGDAGASSGAWGGTGGEGGAVYVTGDLLSISGSFFTNNEAGNSGASGTAQGRQGGSGGAISIRSGTSASLLISTTSFSANIAGNGSPAVGGSARGGDGGAVYLATNLANSLVVTSSEFTQNMAGNGSEFTVPAGSVTGARGGSGGAISASGDNSNLVIDDSVFTSNIAGAGAVYVSGAGTASGGAGGAGGAVDLQGGDLVLSDSYFRFNESGAGSAGTSDVNGYGGDGGAIYASNFATAYPNVTVSGTTFRANETGVGARAAGGRAGDGGAIFFSAGASSTGGLLVERSLFRENKASLGDFSGAGWGGALFIAGDTGEVGVADAIVQNSTFFANEAEGRGGAVLVSYSSYTRLLFNTFSDNTGSTGVADTVALGTNGTPSISMGANIVVGVAGGSVTCDAAVTSEGYNRELVTSDCTGWAGTGDQRGVDASTLDAATDNGDLAPALSREPLDATTYVDVIGSGLSLCSDNTVDQRNVARPIGDGCDIGAIELQSSALAVDDTAYLDLDASTSTLVDVLANDTLDTANTLIALDAWTITDVTTPSSGSAVVEGTKIRFTPVGEGEATFDYTVCNNDEEAICSTATVTVNSILPTVQMLRSVTPARLFDTRPEKAQGVVSVTKAKVGGLRTLTVQVTGKAGVPASGVAAVALNVTSTQQDGNGFVTVYPCGSVPDTSNLNFVSGVSVPNLVIAPVSASGKVCFYANTNTHLIADISGWFAIEAGFASLTPTRVFDTRPEKGQGAVSVTKTKVGPSRTLSIKITGKAGVPSSGVSAVALNVTSTQQGGNGFVTVYPCGTVPDTSNLNFVAGVSVPNAVIAPVSDDGRVCFVANTDTHLIADVSAWFAEGSTFTSIDPVRLADTRPEKPQGEITVSKRKVGGPTELRLRVTGEAGLPSFGLGIAAVALNVTSTQQDGNGFVTVYPCGSLPDTSNLNFRVGVSVPNAVIAPVSGSGDVCLYANTNTHLIVDISGWFESLPL
ncbi:MAG: hypothetical protein RLZ04_852 [Actinomycetota bacterium]